MAAQDPHQAGVGPLGHLGLAGLTSSPGSAEQRAEEARRVAKETQRKVRQRLQAWVLAAMGSAIVDNPEIVKLRRSVG